VNPGWWLGERQAKLTGFSFGARHHLRPLPATAPSTRCRPLSAGTDESISDLATGDVCPAGGMTPATTP
jgi:hypothetical protein